MISKPLRITFVSMIGFLGVACGDATGSDAVDEIEFLQDGLIETAPTDEPTAPTDEPTLPPTTPTAPPNTPTPYEKCVRAADKAYREADLACSEAQVPCELGCRYYPWYLTRACLASCQLEYNNCALKAYDLWLTAMSACRTVGSQPAAPGNSTAPASR
jgi:hypothetical protein